MRAGNRHMRATIAVAVLCIAVVPASADEDMETALDRIAPMVASGELEALGGPETATGIVSKLVGRWFTLNRTVRNWHDEGTRSRLQDTIAQLCADDWENIVHFEPLGPDGFRIIQTSPEGMDQGTFDMFAVDGGRTFKGVYDDAYLTALWAEEGGDEDELRRMLKEMRTVLETGQEIWLPHPDIQISRTDAEVEVWGRCPE